MDATQQPDPYEIVPFKQPNLGQVAESIIKLLVAGLTLGKVAKPILAH